jgi:hypothetical protein
MEAADDRSLRQAGDRILDTWQADLRPRKHWTVYFVPITHHDLGYTDTIENVLNRYAGFYDDVVRFCEGAVGQEAKYGTLEDLVAAALCRESTQGSWIGSVTSSGPDRDQGPCSATNRQSAMRN